MARLFVESHGGRPETESARLAMSVSQVTLPSATSTLSVSLNTSDNASFQNALLNTIQQGLFSLATSPQGGLLTDPSLPPSQPVVLALTQSPLTGSITLANEVAGFVDLAPSSLTVTGNRQNNQTILAGGGNLTFNAVVGESGTIAAGSGNVYFSAPSGVVDGTWLFLFDDTTPAASNTVVAGGATAVIQDSAGEANLFELGQEAATVGAFGADTILGGSGSAVVFLNSGGSEVQGGTGPLEVVANQPGNTVTTGSAPTTVFANTGGNTVIGGTGGVVYVAQPSISGSFFEAGAGNATVFALSGSSGIYQAGTGELIFIATSGSSSTLTGAVGTTPAIVFGDAGGNVVFNDQAVINILVASGDNTTLNAAGSEGGNAFFNDVGAGNAAVLIGGSYYDWFIGGAGNATMEGGSGHNFFQFIAGQGGGNDLITNWNSNDLIQIYNYAPNTVREKTAGGAAVITLPDGTTITVQGQSLASLQGHIQINP
jgi:hypothetical protein